VNRDFFSWWLFRLDCRKSRSLSKCYCGSQKADYQRGGQLVEPYLDHVPQFLSPTLTLFGRDIARAREIWNSARDFQDSIVGASAFWSILLVSSHVAVFTQTGVIIINIGSACI
jgi:hypothetical protein